MMDRSVVCRQLIGFWTLLVAIDAVVLRARGTGAIHAAFSVLHDPATTFTYLAVIPSAIVVLSLVLPVNLIQAACKQYKVGLLLAGLVISGFVVWWNVNTAVSTLCEAAPYPEDFNNSGIRTRLTDLQSNYWAAVVGNSDEDRLAASDDYHAVLTQARKSGCSGIEDFFWLGSLRAHWSLLLATASQLLPATVIWILVVHLLQRTRIDRILGDGFAVMGAIFSFYPVLLYYSEWYISFGATVVKHPAATIAGILASSGALFLLSAEPDEPRAWQRVAQSLAAGGLIANLLCVVWPTGFEHAASHFATFSLAVVFFAQVLLAFWIVIAVKLFGDSIVERR